MRAIPGDRTSPLAETTWDDALNRLVTAIERTQATHGRDAVGCFGGGSLTDGASTSATTAITTYPVRDVNGDLVVDV